MANIRDIGQNPFWMSMKSNFSSADSIEELLKSPDWSVDALLADDNFVQECRSNNAKLINFLCKKPNLKRLLEFIIVEPDSEANHNRGHKFPFIVSEVLWSDSSEILDIFFKEDQEHEQEQDQDQESKVDAEGDEDDIADKQNSEDSDEVQNSPKTEKAIKNFWPNWPDCTGSVEQSFLKNPCTFGKKYLALNIFCPCSNQLSTPSSADENQAKGIAVKYCPDHKEAREQANSRDSNSQDTSQHENLEEMSAAPWESSNNEPSEESQELPVDPPSTVETNSQDVDGDSKENSQDSEVADTQPEEQPLREPACENSEVAINEESKSQSEEPSSSETKREECDQTNNQDCQAAENAEASASSPQDDPLDSQEECKVEEPVKALESSESKSESQIPNEGESPVALDSLSEEKVVAVETSQPEVLDDSSIAKENNDQNIDQEGSPNDGSGEAATEEPANTAVEETKQEQASADDQASDENNHQEVKSPLSGGDPLVQDANEGTTESSEGVNSENSNEDSDETVENKL